MKSTFVCDDGSRLVVEPSPTFRNVRVWNRDRADQIITIPVELAGSVAAAIEAAARLAAPESDQPPEVQERSKPVPTHLPDGRPIVQAFADTNGLPPPGWPKVRRQILGPARGGAPT